MPSRLLAPLLCLSLTGLAQAQTVSVTGSTVPLAGQSMNLSTASDPELNWRDPTWLTRQRERSRWRYQIGLEQQLRSPVQYGPQAAVREAVWAGVSYDLTSRISGGLEAPVWQRDTGWASRVNFQRSKNDGLTGLRGAFSYQLNKQSKLTLRPQARRIMVGYSATW